MKVSTHLRCDRCLFWAPDAELVECVGKCNTELASWQSPLGLRAVIHSSRPRSDTTTELVTDAGFACLNFQCKKDTPCGS